MITVEFIGFLLAEVAIFAIACYAMLVLTKRFQ